MWHWQNQNTPGPHCISIVKVLAVEVGWSVDGVSLTVAHIQECQLGIRRKPLEVDGIIWKRCVSDRWDRRPQRRPHHVCAMPYIQPRALCYIHPTWQTVMVAIGVASDIGDPEQGIHHICATPCMQKQALYCVIAHRTGICHCQCAVVHPGKVDSSREPFTCMPCAAYRSTHCVTSIEFQSEGQPMTVGG